MVKDLNDPSNRDTIPAMLTAGEFVLNKEATAMYGPMLQKMNNHGLQQRKMENRMVQGYNWGGLVDFIREEEGFRDKAYIDPVGKWTIGFGRTTNPDGSPVTAGQTTTREGENEWLDGRLQQERDAVAAYGKQHGYDWNPNQIDSLASFRYNGGQGMLEKLTKDGTRSNEEIAAKIPQYNKGRVNGQLQALGGLTRRRGREAEQFNAAYTPADAGVPPDQPAPPPPNSDEALLNNSSDAGFNIPQLTQEILSMEPDQQEIALNNLPPEIMDQVLDHEEKGWRTNNALQTAQLQAAVTAPDAQGAQFIQDRVDALSTQLNELGVPPESQGVGAPVQVGGADGVPAIGAPPELAAQGAGNVPLLDQRPPELATPEQAGGVAGLEASAGPSTRGKAGAKAKPAETVANVVKQVAAKEPIPEVQDGTAMAAQGKAMFAEDPKEANGMMGVIKDAFGDIFDKKELVRMGVLYAGALATGASSGQALAIAGQSYMNRIDAKENTFNGLVKSAKYTPQSLSEYKKTGDPSVLSPVDGAAGVKLSNDYTTLYNKRSGQPTKLQEVELANGNKAYMDEQGRIRSGFEFGDDPSVVRGTKEYRARVKNATTNIGNQLDEMRKTFDIFDKESGSAKTDILPSTNASKISEWAIENGVNPEELGGLVESAYHDALNDNRQDGSRARDLVPYLNQLVIRQQVGGNADVFKSKNQPKNGPASYVNAAKLQKLNTAAAGVLRRMGKQGGTSDLSNLFYTEALKDWNSLDPDTKELWGRKAQSDESGFYLFAENMLIGGM